MHRGESQDPHRLLSGFPRYLDELPGCLRFDLDVDFLCRLGYLDALLIQDLNPRLGSDLAERLLLASWEAGLRCWVLARNLNRRPG